jgi:hypothetical protein
MHDGACTRWRRLFDVANHPDLTERARCGGNRVWQSAAADPCFSRFDAVLVIGDGSGG